MTYTGDKASPARTTVRIPTASGDELEAWLYLPEGNGPHPVVVMAHGIGGIKAGGLAPFAERFREAGFVAIAFDYPKRLCIQATIFSVQLAPDERRMFVPRRTGQKSR